MNSMKKIFSVIVLLAFALLSAGCGGGKTSGGKELVVWVVGSEGEAKTILEISEKFTRQTGIEVSCQAISWGNAHSKYLISIAGDVTPDIGTMGLTWGMEFGEKGAMVDLEKAYPDDVALMEKKIFKGIFSSTRVDGKVYGVPFDMTEHVLFYRTDMISEPPRTWEDLMETINELASQDRGMIVDWGSLDWIGYSPFLWQAGGDYYNDDLTKATLDTPEAAEALEFFAGLYKAGVPRTNVPMEQGMRTGDYPLAIAGNWKMISLSEGAPELEGKWSIATLPKGPAGKRTAFIGGRVIGIFKRSPKRHEAWKFIKFLSQPENQTKLYEGARETNDAYLPPNMDAWKRMPMDSSFKDILVKQANDAKGPPPVISWDASTRFVNRAIQRVIFLNADPREELKKANDQMQKELDLLKQP